MNDVTDPELTDERLAQACFPIRTVVAETGVNAITLRAWERRYGLIRPIRTPSGHRLYTRDDIDLVRRVLVLQDQGVPVSRAMSWLQQNPNAMIPVAGPLGHAPVTLPSALPATLPATTAAASDQALAAGDDAPSAWQGLRARMLDAATRYDDFDLDTAWTDAIDHYPVDVVIRFLLLPVAGALQEQQPADAAQRAALAFYFAFLRNRLGARFVNQSRDAQGSKVALVALGAGASAELNVLLTGIAMAQLGLRPLLFAPGTAIADIGTAMRHSRTRGLLVLADQAPPSALVAELAALAREGSVVFAGGNGFLLVAAALRTGGVVTLDPEPATAARLVRDILTTP